MKKICFLLFFISSLYFSASGEINSPVTYYTTQAPACKVAAKTTLQSYCTIEGSKDTVVHRKHRLIAAILAFPFPFGVFGLHRMYLGTSVGVPFCYIATLGGAFGILPFVDFVLILLCKDVNAYAHNPHIFMWTHRKKH